MDRTTARGGCSLTTCSKAASVLADGTPCTFADVAQWVERGHAMAEATSSRLVIRSTSGVSMHSEATRHGVGGPGMCATQGLSHVQRDTTSDGMLACGHSRSGNPVAFAWLAQDTGVSVRLRGFRSRTRCQNNQKLPRSRSGVEIGRNDCAAPEPVTGWIHCLVNSVARVPAYLAGSRGMLASLGLRPVASQRPARCACRATPARGARGKHLVSSAGFRAPAYEAGGRTFESCTRYQHCRSSSIGRAAASKAAGASPHPFALAGMPARTLRSNGPKAERSEPSDPRVQIFSPEAGPNRGA
jgi:hypothetical protein